MGEKLNKFLLLMWKNYKLQCRQKLELLMTFLMPISIALVVAFFRSKEDPKVLPEIIFQPFCTTPVLPPKLNAICDRSSSSVKRMALKTLDSLQRNRRADNTTDGFDFANAILVYSPKSAVLAKAMGIFDLAFNVVEVEDSKTLVRYFKYNATERTLAGVEFPDSYKDVTDLSTIKNIEVSIRFPAETKNKSASELEGNNWKTHLIYPKELTGGPRHYKSATGAAPSYYLEGFLAVQHLLTLSLLYAREGGDITTWLNSSTPPPISMKRYPHSEWIEDRLAVAIIEAFGMNIVLAYSVGCLFIVKSITLEKEKQLKESMKIMGLPNWLHWTAWFMTAFIMFLIISILVILLLKISLGFGGNITALKYSDVSILLLFFIAYICSIITLIFAISVFFSKATIASIVGFLLILIFYAPYWVLQQKSTPASTASVLGACLLSNSALCFGIKIILTYEAIRQGSQWNNIFTPSSPNDSLSLGLVIIMLVIDTFIYLIIALYVEAIMPGEYGVPKPWNFLCTSKFWRGPSRITGEEDATNEPSTSQRESYEAEPRGLRPGIQIKNLQKVFHKKVAVQKLSLNMYQDQITVLLGHNGAGKTTTISMLTGMIPPTSGTALINGYDIRTDIAGARKSFGICPQHNIIFDSLTVADHLYFFSRLKGCKKNQVKMEIDKFIGLLELTDKRDVRARKLSGGMKRKLCIGIALCGNSQIVMLDEPTAGIDPTGRRALWDLLLNEKPGRTMLLTTHLMEEADLLGDRIAIMAGGELQCVGSSFFLKKKYGAGYRLIMEKSRECDPSRVTQLLKKYIPNIEIQSNIGAELTYVLPENQSSKFEGMLKDLEGNTSKLGILSYGISLTTLEEVFLKVGADHGSEDGDDAASADKRSTADKIIKRHVPYTKGPKFVLNQVRAMLMKRFISTYRAWILLLCQIILMIGFIVFIMVFTSKTYDDTALPALRLDLYKFSRPVTLVEGDNNDYMKTYLDFLNDHSYKTEVTENIAEFMIDQSSKKQDYIVGASFEKTHITAWFNNNPYHSPAISLALVLNAIYRVSTNCRDCSITFTNHPMPFTPKSQVELLADPSASFAFTIAINLLIAMIVITSFFIMFIVKERSCHSKHMQYVSGMKVIIFWLTTAIWDTIFYLIVVILGLIVMVCFQKEGYSTIEDIGRLFLIFFYFGWSVIPLMYIAGYIFDIPSTGYTYLIQMGVLIGLFPIVVLQILALLNIDKIAQIVHYVFLISPYYSFAMGVKDAYIFSVRKNMCEQCINGICLSTSEFYYAICKNVEGSYYAWEQPGIGKNLLYSLIEGLLFYIILLSIDYNVLSGIVRCMIHLAVSRKPAEISNEDEDVAEERRKITNANKRELVNNNTLVLCELTKYYKSFLAVNSLCLAVQEYECFGLLGLNGAGKTTTFKMMTGDVRISYGDGWLKGCSLRRKITKVRRYIGYCPQFDALLDNMTARETIKMFALIRGIRAKDCKDLAESLAKDFDFKRHIDKKVKELSGGNKRKLSTAICLIGDPPVIFLDEPTAGMDPATRRYLWNSLCKIRDKGKCIILTSHSMEECEALCTRLAIMVNGQFKCLGSIQHLKNKFTDGYTLMIKLKKQDNLQQQEFEKDQLGKFLKKNFPGTTLKEQHQELLIYYIKNKSMPWSQMFGILEKAKKDNANIEDYSLGQSSLEQVFLTFTKHQQDK